MEAIKFIRFQRREHRGLLSVRGETGYRAYELSVHYDLKAGEILYPVYIRQNRPGMEITLESDDSESCTLPPSIPTSMVEQIRDELGRFDSIVTAARQFVEENRPKKER